MVLVLVLYPLLRRLIQAVAVALLVIQEVMQLAVQAAAVS